MSTKSISEFNLLQLHRFKEWWAEWHVTQDTAVFAAECRALENYLRAVGLGEKVDEIKAAYKKEAWAGITFLDLAVKSGALPA